jgi:hypothetical protein
MHVVVQEGEASVTLRSPIQAPDDSLRSTSISNFSGYVKVYYRDFEMIHMEAREGSLEIPVAAIGAISWTKREKRYQLKLSDS